MNDEREAERVLVQAHGTWKLLPLRMQRQWLESWSSYLIRPGCGERAQSDQ